MLFSGEQIKKSEIGGARGTYGRQKLHTEIWWGDPRERDRSEDVGVDGRVILKWTFKKLDGETWNGLIWLRIGTGGGPL